MEADRRLTMEEIDERHPKLMPALREHPHVGWLLVRSAERGPLGLGGDGEHRLDDGTVVGADPLADFSPPPPAHLLRTDGFSTSPTSWSAASTTPTSTRAARSRS